LAFLPSAELEAFVESLQQVQTAGSSVGKSLSLPARSRRPLTDVFRLRRIITATPGMTPAVADEVRVRAPDLLPR
jgi:hypothetical protein